VAHILIVEDEPEVRLLYREILEARGHSIDEAFDVMQARGRLAGAGFDLVLCDINLPGETGLALVRHVADDFPDTAIVMVTAVDQPARAEEALSMGACGYIVKPCRPNDLVISVSAGLRMREVLRSRRQPDVPSDPPPSAGSGGAGTGGLTRRESEVIRLMAEGMSNRSIAVLLDLQVNTVRNHVQRVLRKLGAHSKLEAVAVARRRGLLPRRDPQRV
jgi:putative two-component system response regulator